MMEMDLLKSVGDYHQLFLKKLFQQLPHLYQQEYQYYFLLLAPQQEDTLLQKQSVKQKYL